MRHRDLSRRPTRRSQRGIATILIVLFTGTALTAATLGTMYRIRGAQEQSVALHAQTQAQIRAWTGAELLRTYLGQLGDAQYNAFVSTLRNHLASAAEPVPIDLQHSDGTPVSGITARFTQADLAANTITARITGTTEEGNRSEARATLEVVYGFGTITEETEGNTGSPAQCTAQPRAAVVLRGDVGYTGGNLTVTNSNNALTNVAVEGKLTIGSASMAGLSGCTKDDVTLSGGGIAPNAALWSEGNIRINNMSPPNNVSLWGRNIQVGQEGNTYGTVQAGAFTAEIVDAATLNVAGTTIVGGTLEGSLIRPHTSNTIVITLADGSRFALPVASANVDDDGVVTPGNRAKRLSGSGGLPQRFTLRYTGIDGGELSFARATANILWGNNVTITGWQGNYANLYAFGNVSTNEPTIGTLRAGRNLTVRSWNLPNISNGRIGGNYTNTGGNNAVPANLQRNFTPVPWSSLPGRPYCDTSVDPVDVDPLRSNANYVFYFDGNTPMLQIQNVVRRDNGESLEGVYNLLNEDLRSLAGEPFLQCGWGNNHCMRSNSATPANGWTVTGLNQMPPGVLWFEGSFNINGVGNSTTQLHNSVLTTGNMILGNSGSNKRLYAANFATPAQTCGTRFYPTNLCNGNRNTPGLATWTDADGATRTGMPIGNLAIMAEGRFESAGWNVWGSTLIGGGMTLTGATTTIRGAVTVGANSASPTTVSQGGLAVILDGLINDQLLTPGVCTPAEAPTPGSGASTDVRIIWSRYQ